MTTTLTSHWWMEAKVAQARERQAEAVAAFDEALRKLRLADAELIRAERDLVPL